MTTALIVSISFPQRTCTHVDDRWIGKSPADGTRGERERERETDPLALTSHDAVMELGKIVKKSVEKENMLAWQFNTIGVSDAVTMGSDGRHWSCSYPSSSAVSPH